MFLSIPLILLSLGSLTDGSTAQCFSVGTTYSLCIVSGGNITVVSKNFTGALLEEECHDHFMEDVFEESCETSTQETTTKAEAKTPTTAQRYGYGFLAVSIVSALSIVGLLAVPCLNKTLFQYMLAAFTALAVGTLFGDAMFHLIPFTFGLHGHENTHGGGHDHPHRDGNEHDHSTLVVPIYQWRALVAVMVLYGFYLLEVFLHSMANFVFLKNSVHCHGHDHGAHLEASPRADQRDIHENGHELDQRPSSRAHQHDYNEIDSTSVVKSRDAVQKKTEESVDPSKISRATGWMVIIGDAIHNFADGLAIGAAFSEDLMIGLTTTIAIGCHELPHELGDYAVLIQSGFTHCRALLWNFLSATTAIVGFFIGAAISTNESVRQWIFAVTVGMFLYIALVDLLPTLLPHGRMDIKRFICVNIGFLMGIAIMFLLAIFEEKLIHAAQ